MERLSAVGCILLRVTFGKALFIQPQARPGIFAANRFEREMLMGTTPGRWYSRDYLGVSKRQRRMEKR